MIRVKMYEIVIKMFIDKTTCFAPTLVELTFDQQIGMWPNKI